MNSPKLSDAERFARWIAYTTWDRSNGWTPQITPKDFAMFGRVEAVERVGLDVMLHMSSGTLIQVSVKEISE